MADFFHSGLFQGTVAGIAFFVIFFGGVGVLLALPESIRNKLFKDRRPRQHKPPSAFQRSIDRFMEKHGGLLGAFIVAAAVAGITGHEAFWYRTLIIGFALHLAFVLGGGPARS